MSEETHVVQGIAYGAAPMFFDASRIYCSPGAGGGSVRAGVRVNESVSACA